MKRYRVFLVLLLFFLFPYKTVFAKTEGCLGGFCFYGPLLIPEPELAIFFGDGFKKEQRDSGPMHMEHTYYDPASKLWVQFSSHFHGDYRLETILVTKTKLCEENYQPARGFGNLEAPTGIGIGSAEKHVIETYGKPSRIRTSDHLDRVDKGMKTLVYSDTSNPLFSAEFFFKDNLVHSMSIGVSE